MRLLPFDYATRNLGRSPPRLLLAVAGSALVVVLVIAAAGFVRGMRASLSLPGAERNAILLGAGSEESIERSEISMRVADIAAAMDGVRVRLGVPYVSPEVHLALSVRRASEATDETLVLVRGVRPVAQLVHPQVEIVEGRPPEPGRDEVMIGSLVPRKLGMTTEHLPLGGTLSIDGRPWTISGRFRAPRTTMDAEIWMPLVDLQVIARRDNLSCVVVTLDPLRGDFSDVETLAATRLDLELAAMPETAYYGALARFYAPIRSMVLATAALIAVGGILGGLNTMVAAFAARVREVGTLQVLGFPRRAIVISLAQESLIIAATGALLAGFAAKLFLDGLAVNFSLGAFGLVVDAPVLAVGLGAGVILGLVGVLPPALRCLRLPVAQALKGG